MPLDQNGMQPVSFTFPASTSEGTTTVTTSTTGPTPTGFTTLTGSSPAYYELSTTAGFTGEVLVCIAFDTTGMTQAEAEGQHLYHYVSDAWVDITDAATTSAGRCAGSRGPSRPSRSDSDAPVYWPFEGFPGRCPTPLLTPRMRRRSSRSVSGWVVTLVSASCNGSPVSQRVNCTDGAPDCPWCRRISAASRTACATSGEPDLLVPLEDRDSRGRAPVGCS